MNRTDVGKPYLLSAKEEFGIIKKINISLYEYEKNIEKFYPMDIAYAIVISGMQNCLFMIQLYSKKEGLNNDRMYDYRIFDQIEFPNNLKKKFRNMRMIRNGIAHKGVEGGEIDLFLINFKEFIKGFNDFYSEKYDVPQPFRIDSLCNSISFLLENYDFDEDKKPAKILNTLLNYDEQFTEDYEKLKIKEINKLIKTLEKEIRNIEIDSYYYSILLYGQKISESMLILYLEKNGYVESYRKFIETAYTNNIRTTSKVDYKNFMQILNFCRNAKILPRNVLEFLRTMQRYRNEGIHGAKPSYDLIKTYLETLNYFLIWFNGFYSQNSPNKNLFEINEISLLIQSLSKDYLIDGPFIKLNKEQKDLKEELDSLEKMLYENKSGQSELENEKISKALENLGKSLEILNKKIDELSETAKRIEDKIDKILHTIDTKLDALQSLISNQINNATSKEEIEKIITDFTNNHVENITKEYQNNISKDKEYEKEKRKLIYTSLGEDAWKKLSDESKTFLVTSKVMYNDLIMIEDITDYSGVCILVSKALEVEMFNRFYTDFIEYMKGKYGENYEEYPSSLIHTNRNNEKSIVFERNFYMGTVVYLLSPKKDKFKKKPQIKHDEKVLLEYCKARIFSNKNEKEMVETLDEYSQDIEDIKDKYRNPSAHRNAIQRVNAEDCFRLVLDHEQLLKKMLDSFDY